MKKTALRMVFTQPATLPILAVQALALAYIWVYLPPPVSVAWTVAYAILNAVCGRWTYRANLDSLRRAAADAERNVAGERTSIPDLERALAELLSSTTRLATMSTATQAQRDDEDERRDREDEILDEDREFRLMQIRITGTDPGPSGQAARIEATRAAEHAARVATARMERKARIAARTAAREEQRAEAA